MVFHGVDMNKKSKIEIRNKFDIRVSNRNCQWYVVRVVRTTNREVILRCHTIETNL